MSPGVVLVLCVVPAGAGDGEPLVGISPARTDTESTQLNVIAVKNRFTLSSPSGSRMQGFLHQVRIEQHLEILARLGEGN